MIKNKNKIKGGFMNRFNNRYSNLLYHLFSEGAWCSVNELSSKTGYSKSTLWRDLTLLNSNLPPGWGIEKNDIYGVRLIKPPKGTLEELWSYFRVDNTYFQTLELILFNNGITINDIIEKVHISRSTVYRHLEKIEEVVKSAGVTLSNSPYKVVGDEKVIRRLMMQYVEYMSGDLNRFITSFDSKDFQNTLFELLKEYTISLHIGAIQRLAIILHISNIRITNKCFVTFSKAVINDYDKSPAFEISKKLFKYMIKCPNRDNQIQEILFFSLYLMSEKMPVNRTRELRDIRFRLNSESGKPFREFLTRLSKEIGIDVSQDEVFLYKFGQFVRRSLYDLYLSTDTRISNMIIYVPYFERNSLFILIDRIARDSFRKLPLLLENVDILEMFMLVQSSILRKKNQLVIETVLACRSYVEEDYIKELLKQYFGAQLNIHTIDFPDIDSLFRKDEFDILITTDLGQVVNVNHIPVFKVSAFPTSAELNEIKGFIQKFFIDKYDLNHNIDLSL